MNQKCRTMLVILNDINDDTHFKISRNSFNPELEQSIRLSGMLEEPHLIQRGDSYTPLTCHNRIKILKAAGVDSLHARVITAPDRGVFMNNVAIKMYKNEIGPMGRLRVLNILENDFDVRGTELTDISKKILKIPADISGDSSCIASISRFPESLRGYMDAREVPYKTIRDVASLSPDLVSELNRWVGKIQVRLNIFKLLVEHLFDVWRRDGGITPIDDSVISSMDDKKLYDYIFRIRYPEYTRRRDMSDVIIRGITGNGISIDFPEYYERGDFTLKINISKRYNSDKIKEVLAGIDIQRLGELISFL